MQELITLLKARLTKVPPLGGPVCLQGPRVTSPIRTSTMLRGLSVNRPGLRLFNALRLCKCHGDSEGTFDPVFFVAPTVIAARARRI